MKCCSIKLADRTEERQSSVKKSSRRCHPAILENDSDSYRPSSSDSKSNESSEDYQPYLSILNIMLPNDTKAFNTGSSTKRWSSKRPRLKSAKLPTKAEKPPEVDVDNLDVSTIIEELQNEDVEDKKVNDSYDVEFDQIDPDIQRLLAETHVKENFEGDANTAITKRISFELEEKTETDDSSKRKLKRRRRKKSKDGDKDKDAEKVKKKQKKKLTKTVSFSLSRPPSPETEQVIRVDVISNYAVEFEATDSNRTDIISDERTVSRLSVPTKTIAQRNDGKFTFQIFCTAKQEEVRDFVVETKRVTLLNRNGEK